MKQLRMIIPTTLSLILLAACGTQSQEDKQTSKAPEQKTEKKETNAKQDKATQETKNNNQTNDSKENTTNQKKEPKTQTGPLTEQEIKHNVALLILNPNLDQKYITGQEVLEGKYSAVFQDQIHHFKVNEVRLLQGQFEPTVIQAPEGMKVYTFDPQSGPYAVYIGVSRDKVAIWRSQAAYENYPEKLADGSITEYNVSDLKKMNISTAQIQAVANKIVIGNNENQKPIRLD